MGLSEVRPAPGLASRAKDRWPCHRDGNKGTGQQSLLNPVSGDAAVQTGSPHVDFEGDDRLSVAVDNGAFTSGGLDQ